MLFSVLPYSGIKRLVLHTQKNGEGDAHKSLAHFQSKLLHLGFFAAGVAIPSQCAWFVARLRSCSLYNASANGQALRLSLSRSCELATAWLTQPQKFGLQCQTQCRRYDERLEGRLRWAEKEKEVLEAR